MRRSYRDALVGFSLVGGIVAFGLTMMWLRGVRVGSKTWEVTANFANASGLAERSPVTYRGILIGSVGNISITPKSVKAKLEISNKELRLPTPVTAKVIKSSLLGGDVQVALFSQGNSASLNGPLPSSKDCPGKNILCKGDEIKGESLSSISTLTIQIEKLIKRAEKEDVVKNIADSTKQFDTTQKELEILILQAKEQIMRLEPIIEEITEASAHINNILAAVDNPQTLDDIQKTASSTRSITKRIDEIGADISQIMEDKELMSAFRSVTIGLGQFFDEIYPSRTRNNNR